MHGMVGAPVTGMTVGAGDVIAGGTTRLDEGACVGASVGAADTGAVVVTSLLQNSHVSLQFTCMYLNP